MSTVGHTQERSTTPRGEEEATSHERARRTTRWGPAWAGAVVALPVFLVLHLLFIAFGGIALGVEGAGSGVAASIVSAALAVIAMFVGGLAAGTASSWAGLSSNAALQGAMTWALSVLGVLFLALAGGGPLAGTLGGLVARVALTGSLQLGGDPAVVVEANQALQNGAGWAALWLGLAFVAALLGTMAGASASKGTGKDPVAAGSRQPDRVLPRGTDITQSEHHRSR